MARRSLDKESLLGIGLTADVHLWEPGRVLKLFRPKAAASRVELEFQITQSVYDAGLPAPRPFEIIELGDRRGIILERVEGPSLLEHARANPWTLFAAARQLAEIHAQLHEFPAPARLPRQRQWISEGIELAANATHTQRDEARRCLVNLPDGETLCHGDLHPGNIHLTPRGPLVIDWETASRGHALGDVACTSHLLRRASLPQGTSWSLRLAIGALRSCLHASYLQHYLKLRAGTRDEIQAWSLPIAIAAQGWGQVAIYP